MVTPEKLIDTALAEVGYLEKASSANLDSKTANAGKANYTKYGKWYGINPGAWCAMFVSWCADKAGAGDIIPRHASCTLGIEAWKKLGRWHPCVGYDPKAGDIIYFCNTVGAPQHVGIVSKVTDDRVYTIEGNTADGKSVIANGGAVCEKNYAKRHVSILGYGSPEWPVEEPQSAPEPQRYNNISDMPEWAQSDIQALVDSGVLRGDNGKLDLSIDMIRTMIVCKRMIDGR